MINTNDFMEILRKLHAFKFPKEIGLNGQGIRNINGKWTFSDLTKEEIEFEQKLNELNNETQI